jgi:CubicO group peptidase (beta-lactamase class C family)
MLGSFSRRAWLGCAFGAWLGVMLPGVQGEVLPGRGSEALVRSGPAAEGVSAEGILQFLEAVAAADFELHSLMVLRHGKVVAEGWWEPYGPDFVHTMYSMSKSFTATAVGLAVAEGKLKVEDKVVSFFPESLPEVVSANLAAMRVKDLLTMATGNEKEPTQVCVKSEDWVRTFLAQPIAHEPGTKFMYNSAATYMCAAIVQKVTGLTVLDYLTPRLFEPLGIRGVRWEVCPRGINTGGWGLSIQTEGLAKFGQLLLQKGMWQGRSLLPAAWVEEATRFHIQQPGGDKPDRPVAKNDWLQGYGYQFWRCQGSAFRGDGAFGQFTIVLPEQEAVIVMTSENKNMQGQLDLVWKHLLPAFDGRGSGGEKEAELKKRLAELKVPMRAGGVVSAVAAGLKDKVYALEANDLGLSRVSFRVEAGKLVFTAWQGEQAHALSCGLGSWQRGEVGLPGTPPRLIAGGKPEAGTLSKVAARAVWLEEKTLEMTWRYYETPHRDTVTCEFDGEAVTIQFLNSITGMNPKGKDVRPVLRGRLSR